MDGRRGVGGFGFAMHLPERDGIVADLSPGLHDEDKKKAVRAHRRAHEDAGPSFYHAGATCTSAPRSTPW